jgi:hypothetical protein
MNFCTSVNSLIERLKEISCMEFSIDAGDVDEYVKMFLSTYTLINWRIN